MLKLADRVKETSITVGSGLEIALAGAFGAFQTFASTIGDGNSTYYTIENNSNFEVGVGTYNSSGNTLSRDLVLSSTNNNQRISLDGVSIVFCCYPASQAVLLDNGLINSPSPNYSGIVFPSSTVIDTALLSGVVSESILPTSVVYSDDSRLSDSRNPNPHTHLISDITALQSSLDSKQPTGSYAQSVHSHVVSDVQGLQTALDNKQVAGSYAASSHSHTSSHITDFAAAVSSVAPPTTNADLLTAGTLSDDRLSNNIVRTSDSRLSDARTPLSHSHSISDVTNLQSSLDSKQVSGNYASSIHQHLIADVSGLQSALNNKQASGNYATSIHSHLASDITDFASAVNTYAPPTVDASLLTTGVLSDSRLSNNIVRTTDTRLSDARTPLSHNHNISDVSGLQTALDSKQASGNYAASSHTHAISSVSGLQSALDGKQASGSYASLSHTHTSSNITDFNSSVSGLINGIYAPISSPTLTGVPLTPTASSGTNTNQIASTSFVRTEISNLVASSPATLDTLNELATALGNDPNFATTVTNSLANKAALAGASFTGAISSPSGSFTSSLKVNNTDVSLNGHGHSVSDISGLQTSLDGKQPSGSYASLSHTHSIENVTGLQTALDGKQASGSYAALSHNHSVAEVTGLQTALDGKQPSGSYAASSHSHTASQITDFNTSVSGLVNGVYAPLSSPTFTGTVGGITKTMVGLGNVDNTSDANKPISSATQTALDGKQASGSYAASSHTHTTSNISDSTIAGRALLTGTDAAAQRTSLGLGTIATEASGNYALTSHAHSSSNITDFNTSVSGLLPVKDIVPGTNVTVTSSSGIYTINSTGSGGGTQILSYATVVNFPATGSTSSYYFASDSSKLYQWTGSQYVEIGPSLDTISASNITLGTLPDERLSNNITRNDNLRWAMQANTNSIDWLPRGHGTIGNAAIGSGSLVLAFFTAPYNMTCTRLTFVTGGTATASLSLCRFALFTVNETVTDSVTATTPVVTMVARTASDTTIGNATQTMFTRTFNTTGGYPASYDLVAGTRYAAGIIVVGTTTGTWQAGTVSTGAFMRLPPMVAGVISGLTDIPTAATSVSTGNFMIYGRIS